MILITPARTISIEKQADLTQLALANEIPDEMISLLTQWFGPGDYVEVNTSGSTGTPKKIRLPKLTMLHSAQMTNAFFGLNSESLALLCLPVSYIAGKMMVIRALTGNYKLMITEPAADPFSPLKKNIIGNFTIDFTAITPYQLLQAAKTLQDFPLRQMIVGGNPVTQTIEELTTDWKTACYETYGMTETASHIALRRFNGKEKSDSFQALDGITLSVDDRSCLEIDAPHLHAEKLTTNDLVEILPGNKFRWLGRIDRVINSGGIKVFPEQIEKKIEKLLQVPCFIDSEADEALGRKVILVTENKTLAFTGIHPDAQSIIVQLKNLLDKFEMPKKIYTMPEFVYSSGNKILRNETIKKMIFNL